MAQTVKAIPEGLHTVTASLCVSPAEEAMAFYEKAFGARTISKHIMQGKVGHAELHIGDSVIFVCDEFPGAGSGRSPRTLRGTTAGLYLYVEDVDAWFARAVKAGVKVIMPLAEMFWGDRFGQVEDPYGHVWSLATRKENLTMEQIAERQKQFFASAKAS